MSTVLIVDDSAADRALFETILTRGGYKVAEVVRGREALAKAREIRPHAVVLDVNLPDTDGHAVCREIRADPELAGLPVLMLTVRDNDADVLAGLEAGADDYVAKDSDGAIVLARVRRLIRFRQLTSLAVLNEQLVQIGRLLAGIVHEIRGPLSVIRGSAELMRMQLPPDDPSQQWVDPILRSAKLLQVRLEHLMAAVRSGPSERGSQPLAPIVEEATDLFLKGTDPRKGRFAVEAVADDEARRRTVRVDAGRVIQVLLSLLGNAQEALDGAAQAGKVTVRTGLAHDEGREWMTVEVCDNGPGIPEELIERIFEPFFTTKETGSGYGLYLASEVVREQDGRLTAHNLKEGGACFTVWLPADDPSPAAGGEPA